MEPHLPIAEVQMALEKIHAAQAVLRAQTAAQLKHLGKKAQFMRSGRGALRILHKPP